MSKVIRLSESCSPNAEGFDPAVVSLLAAIRRGDLAGAYSIALQFDIRRQLALLLKCGFSVYMRPTPAEARAQVQETLAAACRERRNGWERQGMTPYECDPDSTIIWRGAQCERNYFGWLQVRTDSALPWRFVVHGVIDDPQGARFARVERFDGSTARVSMTADDALIIRGSTYASDQWQYAALSNTEARRARAIEDAVPA